MPRIVRKKLSGFRRRDRISELPDHLLLNILVLLPIAEAIRTSMLSRRWRHVWTRLPLLEFVDDEEPVASFVDLIAGVIRGYVADVDMPDVSIFVDLRYQFAEAVRIATSAFLAAQRVKSSFGLVLSRDAVNWEWDSEEPPLLMPCFPCVKELVIWFQDVELRMPNTGTFASLTKLSIYGVYFTDSGNGIGDVVSSRCPCLRDLELRTIEGLKQFFLHSTSIVKCRLDTVMDLELLHVVAPNLGDINVTKCFVFVTGPTMMYLQLPELKHFHWEDRGPDKICPSLPSKLEVLTVIELPPPYLKRCEGGNSHFTRIMKMFRRIDTLHLDIRIAPDGADQKDLIHSTSIPFFGELDLAVHKNGHMFGPTILNLLSRRSGVRKMSLQIKADRVAPHIIILPCPSNCDCHNNENKITWHYLEWVVMKKFSGTEEEKGL
ncbi:hypothetical protein PR202_ga29650 [Eleusine coracana subsp. coracana]|uniref:F-box domain-containing protein n=1 Tax=Eleusine coracana subsp. coracana TaxID=191504 RepID=A0AAV5DNI6_ELECO|nr:hypothetical protein PR202_ga29650 [Eleusine coracana subsp. coracana]